MLPKARRLGAVDFTAIRQGSRSFPADAVVLRVRYRNDDLPTRFGIVVANKVAKRAVDRHRLKRRVSGVLEDLLEDISPGADCVLYMKSTAREAETAELRSAIQHLFKQATLLLNEYQ